MLELLLAIMLVASARPALAHDIPDDVRVQAFLRAEGERLRLLVRVPLAAMREADIPLRGPGYLDLARLAADDDPLRTAAALWLADNIDLYAGEAITPAARLAYPVIAAARVALASDRSFADYATALGTLLAPPPAADLDLYWKDQYLDVLLEYSLPAAAAAGPFAIEPRLARLGLQVVIGLVYVAPDGASRAFQLHGDAGLVRLDPRWHHAAARFVALGFEHIADGLDHLLFIACLVIPFRRVRALVIVATAFTVAHSITLAAAALGYAPAGLWFPPLVETLIAASILVMAVENMFGARLERRWILAFGFGLVHGFGFAFALADAFQFAGSHLATALVAFNAGVELGQIALVAVLVPVLAFLFRRIPERAGTIVLSAFVAHTAWHWLVERWEVLAKFRLPAIDAAAGAALAGWAIAAVALATAVYLLDRRVRAWISR